MTDTHFRYFADFLLLSLVMAVVAVCLLIFRRSAGKRFTARSQYIVWAVVMLRFALPFTANEWAIFEVVMPTAEESYTFAESVESETLPMPVETEPLIITEEPVESSEQADIVMETQIVGTWYEIPQYAETDELTFAVTEPDETSAAHEAGETQAYESVGLSAEVGEEKLTSSPVPDRGSVIFVCAVVVWLVGALWTFCSSAVKTSLYLRGIGKTLRPADESTLAVYEKVLGKYKIRRAPELYVSPAVGSPMLYGYFSQRIVLPDLALDENQAFGILSHELTHCKRGDLFLKVIALLGKSLHWFNPMAHIAERQFASSMELSCDERVLDGMSDEVRLSYGAVMLDIIKRCNHRSALLTTQFNPEKSAVRERFVNILDSSKKRRGVAVVLVAAILCTLAGVLFSCGEKLGEDQIKLTRVLDVEAGASIYVSLDDGVCIAGENICVPTNFFGNRQLAKYNFVKAAREHYSDELDVTAYANYDGSITIRSKTDYNDAADYTELTRIATFDDGILTVNTTERRGVLLDQSVSADGWTVNNQTIGANQILHISGKGGEHYVFGDPTKELGLPYDVVEKMQEFLFTMEYDGDLAAVVSDDGRYMLVTARAIKKSVTEPDNFTAAVIDLAFDEIIDTFSLDDKEILAAVYGEDRLPAMLRAYSSDGYNPVRYRIVRGQPSFADDRFTVPACLISDDGEIMIDAQVVYNIKTGAVSESVLNNDADKNMKTGIKMSSDVYDREKAETIFGSTIAEIDAGDVVGDGHIFSLNENSGDVIAYGWCDAMRNWVNDSGEIVSATEFVSGGQFSVSSRTDLNEDGSYTAIDRLFIRDGDKLYLVSETTTKVDGRRTFEINEADWRFEYRISEGLLYLIHIPRFSESVTYRFGDFSRPDMKGIVHEQGANDIWLDFSESNFSLAIDESRTYAALTYTPTDAPDTEYGVVVDLKSCQIIEYVKPWAADELIPRAVTNGGFRFTAEYRAENGEYTTADYLYDTVTKTLTVPEERELYRRNTTDAFAQLFDNGSAEGYFTPVAIYGETDIFVNRYYDQWTNSYYTALSAPPHDCVSRVTMGRFNVNGAGFSDYMTYDVEYKNGEFMLDERNFSAFSRDTIVKEGIAPEAVTAGEYTTRVYNSSAGALVYTRITFLDEASVEVTTNIYGSDRETVLTGEYAYDSPGGRLTLNLGDMVTGETHTVEGVLLIYDGYVHFICEASTLDTLSPSDPLPLSFMLTGEE